MQEFETLSEQVEQSEAQFEHHFVKIYSLEEYLFWNNLFSTGRNYPVNSGTDTYATTTPDQFTEEVDGESVTYYKFPLSPEIMAIMSVLIGQVIYKSDGSRLFETPLK